MNRKNLTQAVGRIATADGYHFYTAEPREMPQMINTYPAMWLTPPEFSSMQGVRGTSRVRWRGIPSRS